MAACKFTDYGMLSCPLLPAERADFAMRTAMGLPIKVEAGVFRKIRQRRKLLPINVNVCLSICGDRYTFLSGVSPRHVPSKRI